MIRAVNGDGPLDGVRIVALEQAIALPFCTWILSELGADVIKIERPGEGDVVRGWDGVVRGLSSGFVAFNAGKRDIAVDARAPGGREVIRRLAAAADVFAENFAPGVAARLGLGAHDLRAANPRLVYLSLSGYGQDGPYRDVKAYDLLVQGEAGILLNQGTGEAPAKVGMPIADLIGGSEAAIAILAALRERDRGGAGAVIDLALLDAAVSWLGYYPHYAWHGRPDPPRTGMRHQFICPYGPFLAADDVYVNLVVASQEHWLRFCRDVVGRADWAEDRRFATFDARTRHRVALDGLVQAEIGARPAQEWTERLAAAGLPYGRVRSFSEVVTHPQLAHRGLFVEDDSPVGRIPLVRLPGSRRARRPLPGLGEHTEGILTEAGFAPEEIASLRRDGAV